MTGLFNRWISVVLTAAALLAGCGKEALSEDLPDEGKLAGDVYIRFRMNLHGSGIPGSTRAGESTTPGTLHENAVNSVALLVCDAANDKLIDIVSLNETQIELIQGPGLVVPVYVPKMQAVHIYAAVNMTERMHRLFLFGENSSDVSLASTRNDYWDVIDEFVPGSAGKQETLESRDGGCIPMTGQFTIDSTAGKEIEFTETHTTEEGALSVTADVSRIVAKIHVLAKGEDKYANSMSGDERIGWIHLSDVRYMPNGTNKSTYLFPQPNDKEMEYSKWKDPNMDLESYMMGGMDFDLGFDAPAWAYDYAFYNGLALHRENISAASHLAQADAYDLTKFENTTSGVAVKDEERYTEGMYCLENYFDSPTGSAASFDTYEEAIPMVTHVSVAAKLTPRWIVIIADYAKKMEEFIEKYKSYEKEEFLAAHGLTTSDFTDDDVARWTAMFENETYKSYFTETEWLYRDSFRFFKAENEADASDIINWSLKVNNLWSRTPDDFENDKYPDDTFYVYDMKYDNQSVIPNDLIGKQKYLYLTAGAVASAKNDNIDIKTYSVPHLGGWGYYFTYLDQLHSTPQNGKTPYTASQVTRNTYYLITVNNFGMPGGSISRPEYIRVNTEPVGWDYDGKGDINLH